MQACKNQGPNSVKKTLTPTQIFLVCSGRSAKQHSCRPLFSLHSDTSGGGHQSFFALALHCVLYTPKTKHHREDKENAWTHREQNMWVEIETSFFTVLHRHLCELGFYSVPLSHCPVNKRLFGCTFLQKRSKSQELKKEIQSVMVQLFRLFFFIVLGYKKPWTPWIDIWSARKCFYLRYESSIPNCLMILILTSCKAHSSSFMLLILLLNCLWIFSTW